MYLFIVMENRALLAFLPLNWSNFFIEHIFPQVHRVRNCAYPFAERATVSNRRRYVGGRSHRYCVQHISQFLASTVRLIAIWWRNIELRDWLCGQAKSMHSRIYK